MSPNPQQSAQDKKNQADVEKSRQIAEQQRAQVAKDREAIASKAAADQQKAREKNQQNNNQSTQSTEQQQQTQQQQQTTTQEQKTTTQDQQQQQTTQEAQQAQPTEQPPAPPVEQAQDNGASIVDPGTDIFPEQTANPRAKEVADPPLASFLIDPSSTPAAIPTPEPTPTFDLGPSTDSVSSAVPSITGDPIANANSTIPTTSTKKECTKKHTDIPPGTTGAFNTSPNGALPSSSSNQGAMIAGAVGEYHLSIPFEDLS